MKFENRKPSYGDQICVNRGFYSHHGIYIDDEHIVQFGSPTNELDPETAEVMIVDLNSFLKGGELLCANYTPEELENKRTPQEIVNIAISRLGEKGYDIINNNCEHFSNECAFGYKKSEQVNNILNLLGSLFNRG